MIADYDKCNYCLDHADQLSVKRILGSRKIWLPAKLAYMATWNLLRSNADLRRVYKAKDLNHSRGTAETDWYHWGIDRACDAITREGFRIIERDMEIVARDPMIHFVKI